MKANTGKCDLLFTTNSTVSANIEEFFVKNSNEEKLLGIIESRLKIMICLFAKRLAKNYMHLLEL